MKREKRRYVVREPEYVAFGPGHIWAMGCKTREAAIRALERRIARNLLGYGDAGAVIAYDRVERCAIGWSDGIADARQAVSRQGFCP